MPATEVPPGLGVALLAFASVWTLHFVRSRGASPWPAIIAALAIPFTVPSAWVFVRAPATVWAVVMAFKAWELSRGGVTDPRMLHSLGHAAFWLFVPPDSQTPDSAATARRNRGEGRARIVRGLLKVPPALALWALEIHWPGIHDNMFGEAFWALWLTWLGMTATTDTVSGVAMLTGLHVADAFDNPVLARAPRDFWGRRWNLFVHRWVRRFVFRPLGGRRHPIRGVAVVFAFSGLVHEYVVVAALGAWPQRIGWMTGFFAVHGLAVAVEVALMRRLGRGPWLPRPLAVALHLVWLTATAPLFFGPLGEIFANL